MRLLYLFLILVKYTNILKIIVVLFAQYKYKTYNCIIIQCRVILILKIMKSIENLSPEFIAAIKKEVENCPTLQRMNKSEIITVELDDRRNVEFVNKISCRIIQSTYVPRNFLCDIALRISVSNLIAL